MLVSIEVSNAKIFFRENFIIRLPSSIQDKDFKVVELVSGLNLPPQSNLSAMIFQYFKKMMERSD